MTNNHFGHKDSEWFYGCDVCNPINMSFKGENVSNSFVTEDINKGHTVYFRNSWTDPEPDTFTMSVEAAAPNKPKFIVMSGCATWLNLEQAKEVYEALGAHIAYIEKGNVRKAKMMERRKQAKEKE